MKVLVTGKGGNAGSWQVRGVQLGAAMGATVKPMASVEDMRAHDVVLVVKRVPPELLANLRKSGVRWVYDIVDAYPQPECSRWDQERSMRWLDRWLAHLVPHRTVFATCRMELDAGPLNGRDIGYVVYHHHRPGIVRNPIRYRLRTVGYEGGAHYVPTWLINECNKRGLRFVMNPKYLYDLDVVVAMRGGEWDGYAQRHWKSNVKLANAHASGTPFIGAPEAGYQETATGAEYWATTPAEFHNALDWLESQQVRQEVSERFIAASYSVGEAAEDMLCALKF